MLEKFIETEWGNIHVYYVLGRENKASLVAMHGDGK